MLSRPASLQARRNEGGSCVLHLAEGDESVGCPLWTSTRNSILLRLPQHFPHRHLQSLAYLLERRQLQILRPTLERAVIRPMHPNVVCESFLAEILRLTS